MGTVQSTKDSLKRTRKNSQIFRASSSALVALAWSKGRRWDWEEEVEASCSSDAEEESSEEREDDESKYERK